MSKKKIIAIQADQLNSINIKTDTTFLLALEAQKRFHKSWKKQKIGTIQQIGTETKCW